MKLVQTPTPSFSSVLLTVSGRFLCCSSFSFQPAHHKTYSKTCVTSKDSDQPVHPSSLATVLVYFSLNSLEAVEGTCDQRRLRSDCADAQADLSFRWSHKSYGRFCRALAHLSVIAFVLLCFVIICASSLFLSATIEGSASCL